MEIQMYNFSFVKTLPYTISPMHTLKTRCDENLAEKMHNVSFVELLPCTISARFAVVDLNENSKLICSSCLVNKPAPMILYVRFISRS